ncbi:MAG TPA: MBL fold metallo-hydrolase [Desulfobacteria bacterium]|nr:MBL fold metallo-hydrolase [Desulfobacteria bacterium]
MQIKTIPVGEIGANCYIIANEEIKTALIIDPGAEGKKILDAVAELDVQVGAIIITHGHLDHIGAVGEIKQETGAAVLIHALDAPCLIEPKRNLSFFFGSPFKTNPADIMLEDGQDINLGSLSFKVLHTPGHTVGGVCLSFAGGIITGDTLFAGSVGRTDFPGGSAEALLKSIKEKILVLPPETVIYPGHGPQSTIAEQLENNPYL